MLYPTGLSYLYIQLFPELQGVIKALYGNQPDTGFMPPR